MKFVLVFGIGRVAATNPNHTPKTGMPASVDAWSEFSFSAIEAWRRPMSCLSACMSELSDSRCEWVVGTGVNESVGWSDHGWMAVSWGLI